MRVPGIGSPRAVLRAALASLRETFGEVRASEIWESAPVGPSQRLYANAAAIVGADQTPDDVLARLQEIEHRFGRRRLGQRWRARPLDLDIVLWSGGAFKGRQVIIPHPLWQDRLFVTGPSAQIAGHWRDPRTGRTVAQTHARLTRPRPMPSAARGVWALSSVGRATDF